MAQRTFKDRFLAIKLPDLTTGFGFWKFKLNKSRNRPETASKSRNRFDTTPGSYAEVVPGLPGDGKGDEVVEGGLQEVTDQDNHTWDEIISDRGFDMPVWERLKNRVFKGFAAIADREDSELEEGSEMIVKLTPVEFMTFLLPDLMPELRKVFAALSDAPVAGKPTWNGTFAGLPDGVAGQAYDVFVPFTALTPSTGQTITGIVGVTYKYPSWMSIIAVADGIHLRGTYPAGISEAPVLLSGQQSDGGVSEKTFVVKASTKNVYMVAEFYPQNNNQLVLRLGEASDVLPIVALSGPAGWTDTGPHTTKEWNTDPILSKPFFFEYSYSGVSIAGTYTATGIHLGRTVYGQITIGSQAFKVEVPLSATLPTNPANKKVDGPATILEGQTATFQPVDIGSGTPVVLTGYTMSLRNAKAGTTIVEGNKVAVAANSVTGDSYSLLIDFANGVDTITHVVNVTDATVVTPTAGGFSLRDDDIVEGGNDSVEQPNEGVDDSTPVTVEISKVAYSWAKRSSPNLPSLTVYWAATSGSFEMAIEVVGYLPKSSYALGNADLNDGYTRSLSTDGVYAGTTVKIYLRQVGTTEDFVTKTVSIPANATTIAKTQIYPV